MSQPSVKCLLVDDLEENLVALSALLRSEDTEVLTARSGAEALELLLAHEVALALLDVQMPEMDGFELAELMRGSERTRHIPIIFVTAGARDPVRVFRGYDSGAVDFIFKPIDAHVLSSKAGVFFQLHRQRAQLARQLHELSETLRLNEMFTAVLGHDLRNPLSSIVTSADLLERRAEDPGVRKTAARIRSSGRRMNRLIEDLLDVTRIRLAGGLPLQRSETDLGAVCHRVIEEHRAASPEQTIQFDLRGRVTGNWDQARLEQVVSNLVGNAVQHGAAAEPVQVTLDGTRQDAVVLTVANAGSIPEELRPVIFDPFRSIVDGETRKNRLGLGLYIVQQIVRAHGGQATADTSRTGHTAFVVALPRHGAQTFRL